MQVLGATAASRARRASVLASSLLHTKVRLLALPANIRLGVSFSFSGLTSFTGYRVGDISSNDASPSDVSAANGRGTHFYDGRISRERQVG
jgi:hypothetical protein